MTLVNQEEREKNKIFSEAQQELTRYRQAFETDNLQRVDVIVKLALDAETDPLKKQELTDKAIKSKKKSIYASANLTWEAAQFKANRTYQETITQQNATIRQRVFAKAQQEIAQATESANGQLEDALASFKKEMVTEVMRIDRADCFFQTPSRTVILVCCTFSC